jgi:hypothetical protein
MSSSVLDIHAKLYNTLPSIDDAGNILSSNTHIIQKLYPLLREYEGKFGICLVHRHCTLLDNERMVADGPLTEPLTTDKCHPTHWLKSGEPFEFSLQAAELPPNRLFQEFRQIVGDLTIFGIFYIPEEERTSESFRFGSEHTRGRKNIIRYSTGVPTAWRVIGDNSGGPIVGCICSNTEHKKPTPPSTSSSELELDVYAKHLSPFLLDLTAGSVAIVHQSASLLPRVCVLVSQLEISYIKWVEANLDIPHDTACINDTTDISRYLMDLSGKADELSTSICSLSSTLTDLQSRGVHMRQSEEIATIAQLRLVHAQFALIKDQVSAVGVQLNRVPNVDLRATRLREWSFLFVTVSNELQVLGEKSDNVSSTLFRLIGDMAKNEGWYSALSLTTEY